MLTANDTHIMTAGPRAVVIALIAPDRAAAILARRGMDLTIAQLIASGVLSGLESTKALAKQRGLVR